MAKPRLRIGLVLVCILVQVVLLGYGAKVNSPTQCEPAHMVAGLCEIRFGRFDLYCVNPPLARLVAAIPTAVSGARLDWRHFSEAPGARPEFAMGEDYAETNRGSFVRQIMLGRWMCISFSILGAMVCYSWAKALYGASGGLLALALWTFCPNILAHGQLMTPDLAATSLGLAAAFTFWRWLRAPTWREALFSGFVLGLCELAKMTLAIFFLFWPLVWIIYRWPDRASLRPRDWLQQFSMLGARVIVAIYIVNLGYGFEGSFTPLGDFKFVSASLGAEQGELKAPRGVGGNRFTQTSLAGLPIPLPRNYLLGMDMQKRDFEDYHLPSYLGDQFRPKGWWYYYLYAVAIKVPIGTWVLIAIAAFTRFFVSPVARLRDEFVVLSPAILIFTFVSSQTGFSEHMRYVLPAFPYVFIWIGRIAAVLGKKHCMATALISFSLAWSIASSLWVYPHSLSYFNELVGGPTGGPNHLVHSNVDWGQDLLFLKKWLDKHPEARPLKLAYFGLFDPIHVGFEYTAPDAIEPGSEIPPGWYAISVNFVRGLPYFAYKGDGTKVHYLQGALSAFQQLEPVAMAGYSIYIYHVPDDSEATLRE